MYVLLYTVTIFEVIASEQIKFGKLATSQATYWMTLELVLKGVRVLDNKSKGSCVSMLWVFNISGGSYLCPSDPISSSSFLKNQVDKQCVL